MNGYEYLYEEEGGFCCTLCGEFCPEDEWNDDDVCNSCFQSEAYQEVTSILFAQDRGKTPTKFKKLSRGKKEND